jgi:putative ABC transport system permease protein
LLIPFPGGDITGDNFFQVLYAQAASASEVPTLTQQMDHLLHSRHRKEARYSVENLTSLIDTANKISLAFLAVLLAVAILTLTVAGTGIMNIMFFNVSQRTHEIGLRKALGATPGEIRVQFLLEALLISFAGAVVGVVTAITLLCKRMGDPKHRAVQHLVDSSRGCPSGSTGLGAVRIPPCRRCGEVSPIEALRIE